MSDDCLAPDISGKLENARACLNINDYAIITYTTMHIRLRVRDL